MASLQYLFVIGYWYE